MSPSGPNNHPKGWGYEVWFHNSPLYCLKGLHFRKGRQCSLHFHRLKTETFLVIEGEFELTLLDTSTCRRTTRRLRAGDFQHIPAGLPHRLKCLREGWIVEASTEHREDDSYRIEPGDSQREATSSVYG